jgi:hypothetical protein
MTRETRLGDCKDSRMFKVMNPAESRWYTIKQVYIEDQTEVFSIIKRQSTIIQFISSNLN